MERSLDLVLMACSYMEANFSDVMEAFRAIDDGRDTVIVHGNIVEDVKLYEIGILCDLLEKLREAS